MKPILIFYILCISWTFTFINAGKAQIMNSKNSNSTIFATESEAAQKAKRDLIEILKSDIQLNLGITIDQIERSSDGRPIRHVNLDFEKILESNSESTMQGLILDDINTVVPLTFNNQYTTIVEIYRKKDGWRVGGIGGQSITNELNKVKSVSQSDILTIYEIPNLQGNIYSISKNGKEVYFTNYSDRFSLSQSVDETQLISILKRDAIIFQREYGDLLKKQKLLK